MECEGKEKREGEEKEKIVKKKGDKGKGTGVQRKNRVGNAREEGTDSRGNLSPISILELGDRSFCGCGLN